MFPFILVQKWEIFLIVLAILLVLCIALACCIRITCQKLFKGKGKKKKTTKGISLKGFKKFGFKKSKVRSIIHSFMSCREYEWRGAIFL